VVGMANLAILTKDGSLKGFDITEVRKALASDNPVKAIITLAHSMHMRVVAEGVETAAQLAFLEQHGCEEYQGYFFSPPVPAATLERLALATTKP